MSDLLDGIPGDMTMLLRLIDSKFETMGAKMDGLQASLDTMNKLHSRFDQRLDDHETRVQAIEKTMESRKVMLIEYDDVKADVKAVKDWMTVEQTTAKNARTWGGAIWGVAGSVVTAFIGWLVVSYVSSLHPAPVVPVDSQHSRTVVESTITAPAVSHSP